MAVALLYALTQLITIVATPMSAAHLRRGVKHSLVWGTVFAAGSFVYLGATLGGFFSGDAASLEFGWGFVVFAVLLGMYRALYWIPYKLVEAETPSPHLHMRGYIEVLIALMPLFAGITIVSTQFAYLHILFGASALTMLSLLPALFLKDTRERFSWSYSHTFKQLFRGKNHGFVLSSLLEGLQGAALFLAWPIAIFIIVGGSYFDLGFIFTITLLSILILRHVYRWLVRRFALENSGTIETIVSVSGWIGRLAAGTPVGIIVADSFSYTTKPEGSVRFDPFAFEQVGDRGSFVDEYTALKEIGLAMGRIMLCLIIFFLPTIFPLAVVLTIVLLIAAVASGIAALLARRLPATAY